MTPTTHNNSDNDKDGPLPPWQVRWKRPRWDRVESGIDSNNDDEYEYDDDIINIDKSEIVDEKWTPISNSSVMLTRREAQTVIRELHRRNKLLISRRSRRRTITGSGATLESSKISAGRRVAAPAPQPSPQTPPPSSPFSSWWKSITSPGTNLHVQGDCEKKINTADDNNVTNNNGKPPIVSIASSYEPNDLGENSYDDNDNADNLSPPSSPTSFSTFSLQPTPKKKNNDNYTNHARKMNSDMDDDIISCNDNELDKKEDWSGEGGSSPQIVSDASMASSLLWGEDMTLTTVSEDEAAAYRFHQRGGSASLSNGWDWSGAGDAVEDHFGKCTTGGDRCGAATPTDTEANRKLSFRPGLGPSNRRGQQQCLNPTEDWGGFDHVALSVTIFSTAATSSRPRLDSMDEEGRSGEVVVMELLSTKNLPLPISLGGELIPPSSVPPLPLELPLRRRGTCAHKDLTIEGNATAAVRAEQTKTTSSAAGEERKYPAASSTGNDGDDDGDTTGSQTRLVARRILWWPSSILSGRGDAKSNRSRGGDDRIRSGSNDFPSFVSLGRTRVVKNMNEHLTPPAAHINHSRENDNHNDEDEAGNERPNLVDNDRDRKVHREKYIPSSEYDKDENERAADALEAVRSFNFLLGGGTMIGETTQIRSPKKLATRSTLMQERDRTKATNDDHTISRITAEKKKTKKVPQPLVMCFVTNDGQVHFFYALRVLLSGISQNPAVRSSDVESKKVDLSNSLAALLFGSKLFAKVNSIVLPLSHPHASLRLSLVESYKDALREENRDKGSDSLDMNMNDPSPKRADYDADIEIDIAENDRDANWSSLGLFDASIDPSSIHLRTLQRSNTLTGSCVTTYTENSYLALCGKGLRRIITRNGRGRQQVSHVLGGFVTFVSLRHHTESRTIYLPFTPVSIQPLYWSGMHFVALLGEKTSKKSHRHRRPYAMVIRVDCSQGVGGSTIDSEHFISSFKVWPILNAYLIFLIMTIIIRQLW